MGGHTIPSKPLRFLLPGPASHEFYFRTSQAIASRVLTHFLDQRSVPVSINDGISDRDPTLQLRRDGQGWKHIHAHVFSNSPGSWPHEVRPSQFVLAHRRDTTGPAQRLRFRRLETNSRPEPITAATLPPAFLGAGPAYRLRPSRTRGKRSHH